jgi:hypothetical protein
MKGTNKPKCATKYCRREAKQGAVCCRCKWRKIKETDPVRYTFYYIKNNARRRGKEFGIALDEFRAWVEQTGYMDSKGKQRWSMSIDRIDNSRGYFIDNIRILSLGLNASKGAQDDCPF